MANQNHLGSSIWRRMVPMAAKHGAQSMLKATKAHMAPTWSVPAMVNMLAKPCHIETEFSVASPSPYRTPKVETRFSLAMRAEMVDAVACQLPKPSGAKMKLSAPPMPARIE